MEGLHPNERVDDLQYRGLKIIQDTENFCFGLDAVLLAGFAAARPDDRICDLGTGNGILCLLLSGRVHNTRFDAIEISRDLAERAERNVRLNHLDSRISVYNSNITEVRSVLPSGSYDLVVCNPPYYRNTAGQSRSAKDMDISRTDAACTIDDVSNAAKWLLRNGGKLAVVFPAARMLEVMDSMRAVRIEPKRFRLVSSFISKAPFICLIEGIKGAKPSLHPLPPLILYKSDGSYTSELRGIYHMDNSDAGYTAVDTHA
jgi:tRNA1Val (adenine37-N6)-methyltransferase